LDFYLGIFTWSYKEGMPQAFLQNFNDTISKIELKTKESKIELQVNFIIKDE
jgi:hypothetical protein